MARVGLVKERQLTIVSGGELCPASHSNCEIDSKLYLV